MYVVNRPYQGESGYDMFKKKYEQKYRKIWEKDPLFQGWLTHCPGDPMLAFCKICRTSLRARKKDLEDHQKSRKHKKHLEIKINKVGQLLTSIPKDTPIMVEDPEDITFNLSEEEIEEDPNCSNVVMPNESHGGHKQQRPYTIEVVDTEANKQQETPSATCCQDGDPFSQFGRYVGNELRSVTNKRSLQRAKLEINRILYNVTVGDYDTNDDAFSECNLPEIDEKTFATKIAGLANGQILSFLKE